MAQPPLRAGIGFCLQADTTGNAPSRWYINMCKHRLVEMPVSYSGKPVTKDWILTQGLGCLQVPFDIGAFRKLKERADGARKTAFCIDVVFNPLIISLFMDDEFCNKMDQFRNWVFSLALKRIDETIGVKLCKDKVKLVKQFRYKDGEDGDDTYPREFTELPGDRESMITDDDAPAAKAAAAAAAPEPDPLIQDVTPGTKKKTALKKGFFNQKNAASLYGPEGSKEGVLPENAGDPLGYLPKKLRQGSRIIDCNSPEYQAKQKENKKIEEQNKMNKEMRDTLMEGFDSFASKQSRDIWSSDMPDGTEEAPQGKKYNNDYSRFDRIEDEPEKAPTDDRDYYFDEQGNTHPMPKKKPSTQAPKDETEQLKYFMEQAQKHGITSPEDMADAEALKSLLQESSKAQPPSSGASTEAPSGAEESSGYPAVKKGFLDGKKSIYGPEGSTQTQAPMSDQDMMREFGNLLGASFGESRSDARGDNLADMPERSPGLDVKTSSMKAPVFKLNEAADGSSLQLVVEVPGLLSMHGVNLDVTDKRAMLDFPAGVSLRPLQVELPCAVVPTSVKAKFSKKASTITVTLPRHDVN